MPKKPKQTNQNPENAGSPEGSTQIQSAPPWAKRLAITFALAQLIWLAWLGWVAWTVLSA